MLPQIFRTDDVLLEIEFAPEQRLALEKLLASLPRKTFLADDSLLGRETGSDGLSKAEAYIVDHLIKAGLQPAGVNGFYQPVKFVSREIVEKAMEIAGKICIYTNESVVYEELG